MFFTIKLYLHLNYTHRLIGLEGRVFTNPGIVVVIEKGSLRVTFDNFTTYI